MEFFVSLAKGKEGSAERGNGAHCNLVKVNGTRGGGRGGNVKTKRLRT